MFKQMSNREFSDWLADAAMFVEQSARTEYDLALVTALREASQRIKSDAEWQFDVTVTPKYEDQSGTPTPMDPKGDGSFTGPDGAK